MQRLSKKLSREIVRALSKLCLKTTKIDYRGFKFRVPLFHGAGAEHHLITNDLMYYSLKAFIKTRGGAIIDIGANIGLCLITLKSLNPDIEYYAFEPNPICNFYIMELVRLNHFKKVHIFPFALSNKMERAILYAARMGDKMGSLLSHHSDNKRKKDYSFELVTFPGDQFFDWLKLESICAIKIDVEGSEVKVLQGMKETITKYKPFVFCEVIAVPEYENRNRSLLYANRMEVFNLLNEADYRLLEFHALDPLSEINTTEEFIESRSNDYIFVHRSAAEELQRNFTALQNN